MKDTPQKIANAFLALLEQRPYRRITVQDIVDECGLNRNSFYYHFSSIQDMIAKAAQDWSDEIIFENAQPDSPLDCFRPIVAYAEAHRTALLKLYRSLPKDVLLPMLRSVTAHTVEQYFRVATEGIAVDEEKLQLLSRFFFHTVLGALIDWLEAGMRGDPVAYAEALCGSFGIIDLASELAAKAD